MTANTAMNETGTSAAFMEAVKHRRSIYGISKQSDISDEKIAQIVHDAIKHTPSAFNSQSARIVLLLGANHDKLWDLTTSTLQGVVPADNFEPTQQKMDSFKNGYGTVLFFEDQTVIDGLMNSFPAYAENFPLWSQQSSGMHQFVVWTALENEGFGASLQHYNPLIDDQVKAAWSIADSWKLVAQLPFGKPTSPAGEKEYKPIEERVKIFK